MGEAKRRAEAKARMEAEGKLLKPSGICPMCEKDDMSRVAALPAIGLSDIKTLYGICARCRCMWEAKPVGWTDDVCDGAEPCDNCAFRPGSPEIQNREGWAALLDSLRAGHEFKCHKGCPIDNMIGVMTDTNIQGAAFNLEWMKSNKARSCAGFWRMIWALEKKDPEFNWLRNRYPNAFKEET